MATEPEALRPSNLEPAELLEFQQFVAAAGESNPSMRRIENALSLIRIREGGKLVGSAAVKRPNRRHPAEDFKNSGSRSDPTKFQYELGYIVVAQDCRKRGYGTALIESAIQQVAGAGICSTARLANESIHRRLLSAQFRIEGNPYPGDREPLVLFIRP